MNDRHPDIVSPATVVEASADVTAVDWDWFMSRVRAAVEGGRELSVTAQGRITSDPYRVLVATLISLRTRDEVTEKAAERLFILADSPRKMVELGVSAVSGAIFPANYYPTKAARIVDVSRLIIERHGGVVPADMGALLALPGVGRKTANLVLTEGFDMDAICVDTHVHRIPNRFGLITTTTPLNTENALRKDLPVVYWKEINRVLVPFGQTVCTPVSPRCSVCPLSSGCLMRFYGPSR